MIDVDCDVKGRLLGRMIHTWESPAGVTFFELGDGYISGFILVGILAAVKSGHFIIDQSLEVNFQIDFAGHGLGQKDDNFFMIRIHLESAIYQLTG